jgi:hypothetical protein
MMRQAKQQFQHSFMEIFIIATRQIWKQRNNFIFDRGRPSLESWKRLFCEEARLLVDFVKPNVMSSSSV